MAITAVDKMKIGKYLKEHSVGDIYYLDMCDYLGKRGKISDIEFLEYFTECVGIEFRKNDKISTKQVVKLISVVEAFLCWVHEAKSEISDEVLDKIRSFKEFYDDYLLRNIFDSDEYIILSLDSISNTVTELYPVDEKHESVSKYLNQIAQLESQIKTLEKDLAEVTRLYGNLQGMHTTKVEQAEFLNLENITLGKNLRKKFEEVEELNRTIELLRNSISELQTSLSQANAEIALLTPLKLQCNTLKTELEKMRKRIVSEEETKKAIADFNQRQTKIESLIYSKLLTENASIAELIRYISSKGIESNPTEISIALKNLRQKINIDSSVFSMNPTYSVIPPFLLEDSMFTVNIPFECKYYDIMLVSDFHIKEFDRKVLTGFDSINDYCVKNGINLILNLGDFYQGFSSRPLEYHNAVNNYRIVEESIKLIPQVDGIYHAVLGGNHERNIANYGFDPLKVLTTERPDFISLGYVHSTISLANPTYKLGQFDIHHPTTFDYQINLDADGIDMENIISYLQNIYSRQDRNRDNSYIDIFGHNHKSQFNYPGSYYFIPPFFEGGVKRGACHLRIYFDDDVGIKYMVFMPISVNNVSKLVKTNEIVYQKVLTR